MAVMNQWFVIFKYQLVCKSLVLLNGHGALYTADSKALLILIVQWLFIWQHKAEKKIQNQNFFSEKILQKWYAGPFTKFLNSTAKEA